MNFNISKMTRGGGGYSLIWLIRGCAAGPDMVFVLSVLNRVYIFAQVCPKQGMQFRASMSSTGVHDLCESVPIINRVFRARSIFLLVQTFADI